MAEKKPKVPTRSTYQKDTDSVREFKGGKGGGEFKGATKASPKAIQKGKK